MKNIALHSLLVLAFTVLLISDFFSRIPGNRCSSGFVLIRDYYCDLYCHVYNESD